VRQVDLSGRSVRGITTTTGTLEAPVVILAAGGWTDRLLMPLGVGVGFQMTRGTVGFLEQPRVVEHGHPVLLDLDTGSFLRSHPYRLSAVGLVDPHSHVKSIETLDDSLSALETRSLGRFAARLVPEFENAAFKRGHSILYVARPDGLPALGPVDGLDGLWVAAGFGENAFGLAPGVGLAVARWLVDGTPTQC
jgi:glycine/D-amino acid oxidase-like deaminating enzyme